MELTRKLVCFNLDSGQNNFFSTFPTRFGVCIYTILWSPELPCHAINLNVVSNDNVPKKINTFWYSKLETRTYRHLG